MSVPQQLSGFNNQIPPRYAIKSITKAYRITGADYGQILNCSGTTSYTLSTVPAASIGVGFNCWVWNTTTAISITIDPNGAETIDGNSTLILRPGEGTQITSNGINWLTVAKKTMRYYSESVNSGENASASGIDGIAVGRASSSSGLSSASLGGYSAIASGAYSTAVGYYANATGDNSMSFNGLGYAREINKYSYGSGATYGGFQFGVLPLCQLTTDATPTILTSNLGAAGSTNQLVLQDASAFSFNILAVARQKSANGTASAAWKIEGLIRRETGAATTVLVSSTVTAISNVPGWTLAVSADTTNGCLSVTATGAAATNISWQATATTTEITYA